jgi:hypothetical protein
MTLVGERSESLRARNSRLSAGARIGALSTPEILMFKNYLMCDIFHVIIKFL